MLVQRALFLLNAAFSIEILDLILHFNSTCTNLRRVKSQEKADLMIVRSIDTEAKVDYFKAV
jgi:hypothetical protein